MTTSHVFTVVERIAEPITTAQSGDPIANPCCAVAGAAVPLKVDVLPHGFPDAEIRWRVVSGGGSFSGGGTGRTVQFTASGGEELKNKVAADWFAAFDTTRIIGKVDFCKVWMNGLRKERT